MREVAGGLRAIALPVAVLAAVATAACAPASPRPELLRRFASYELADTSGLVDVSVFSTAAPGEASAPSLLQLSKSAQSELIESLAAKTATLDRFLRALADPVPSSPPDPGSLDRTRFRRRLVVSVENRAAGPLSLPRPGGGWTTRPGSRLSRIRVAVGIDRGTGRFVAWNRFASRHESVDLGRLRLRRGLEGGLGLEAEAAPLPRPLRSADATVGGETTLDEEAVLRDRYLWTGTLRPDSMILLQQGVVGVDLTGNSVLEVEIDLADAPPVTLHRFGGLFDAAGRARPPDSVTVEARRLVHAPALPDGLVGSLRFEAVTRTILPGGGEATLTEGDDRVRYLRTRAEGAPVTLIAGEDVRASVWEIVAPGCERILHLGGAGDRTGGVLHFGRPGEARRFLRWLRSSESAVVAGRRLRLGPDAPLRARDVASLRVRLLPLNWDPGLGPGCP